MQQRFRSFIVGCVALASATVAAAAVLAAGPAVAQDLKTVALPRTSEEAFAPLTGRTTAPMGWAGFCKESPVDCDVATLAFEDVKLTPRLWRQLVAVNDQVNRAIEAVTDEEHWGVAERWSYPTDGKGDCEDYALLKRRLLIEAGVPRQALLMTVVRDHLGEGHAVLTVVTDRGELILDNKRPRILPWAQTGFTFIKRQSAENPNVWVSIGDPQQATTATAAR